MNQSSSRNQSDFASLDLLRNQWNQLSFFIKLKLCWLVIYDAGHNCGLDVLPKKIISVSLVIVLIANLDRYIHGGFLYHPPNILSCPLFYISILALAITCYLMYQFVGNLHFYYKNIIGSTKLRG